MLSAFHNDYVEGVANTNIGFSQTTTLKLLNNMDNSYVTITTSEMENATTSMVNTYDTFKPITKLFVQIEKEAKIADSENTPFKNAQIIAKAYLLVQKMDYTVNNARLGIIIQQQKNMA